MDKIVNKSYFCVFLAIFNIIYIHKFQLKLLLICVFMSNFIIYNQIFCKKKHLKRYFWIFSWPGFWPHTRLLRRSLWVCRTTSRLDLEFFWLSVGLTSKPHHDHQLRFWRWLTWIPLPATGLDFQPQTWIITNIF